MNLFYLYTYQQQNKHLAIELSTNCRWMTISTDLCLQYGHHTDCSMLTHTKTQRQMNTIQSNFIFPFESLTVNNNAGKSVYAFMFSCIFRCMWDDN